MRVPGDGSTGDVLFGGVFTNDLLFNLHEGDGGLGVAHQVPDLDAFFSRSGNPLVLGVEGQLADLAIIFEFSSIFTHVSDIPDLDTLSSTSCGKVLSIRGDGNSVDVFIVMLERASDLEVGVPDLDSSIPSN